MKTLIIFFILAFSFESFAEATNSYVDLNLVALQYRYEDTVNQTQATQAYRSYSMAFQYRQIRASAELNSFTDSTGNQSLAIEKKVSEYLITLGYQVYRLAQDENKISLDCFANAALGQTKTEVKTTLFSNQNTADSESDLVLGLGGSLVGRVHYFLAELDFKYLNSKNMSPQYVPVLSFKMGIGIPLN